VVESRWKEMGEAFHGFDPAEVSKMGEADVCRMLADTAVIRNRRKIEAVMENARRFLERTGEHVSFHAYLSDLGASEDLDAVAEELAKTFTHLGRTSALFFLFSAGWRPQEAVVGAAT
jgi:DNA-3-methyladenine glycosylase I